MKLKSAPTSLSALPSALGGIPQRRDAPNRNKLYGRRWRNESRQHLSIHRYCVMCRARGDRTRATVVDHLIEHKGDERLFWDKSNWQSLCQADHDQTKQAMEVTANGDTELLERLNAQATTAPGVPIGWGGSKV